MDDLQVAYEKYLSVFPLRWDPKIYSPTAFDAFKGLYIDAKCTRKSYEKQLCQGTMNPVTYFTMLALDEFLGIIHTKEERMDGLTNGFAFTEFSTHP